MKAPVLAVGLILHTTTAAKATLYSYDFTSRFTGEQQIPDGNPADWSDSRQISLPGQTIDDVNVRQEISSG